MNQSPQFRSKSILTEQSDDLGFLEIYEVLLKSRNIILLFTLIAALLVSYYLMSRPFVYQTEVLSIVKSDGNGQNGQFSSSSIGSLAKIAGISVNTNALGGKTQNRIFLKVNSRKYMKKYIYEGDINLKKLLFLERWNENDKRWMGSGEPSGKEAFELLSSIFYFKKNVLDESVVTVGLRIIEPSEKKISVMQDILNGLISNINQVEREASLASHKNSIKFLREELESTAVVELRKVIFSLVQSEIKGIMMDRINQNLTIEVIDSASEPKVEEKSYGIVIFISTLLGFLFISFIVLIKSSYRKI